MSNRTLRIIFVAAVLSAILVIVSQYFWIKKAYELEKNIFNTHATIALKNVAVQILKMNDNNSAVDSIVTKVSPKYYTVQINDKIDSVVLEQLLMRELLAQQLKIDFEYSVYDCESEKMKYGKYVSFSNNPNEEKTKPTIFPKNKNENNYFGVHFPNLDTYLTKEMTNWFISTGILGLFLILLGYAIFVIFEQKKLSEIQKDFVNNMTHEFKTPLATIKLSSEVLKNPNIVNNPERLLNYATIINNETTHLTNQVERVLQMAKESKATIDLKREDVGLKLLFEEIIDKKYTPLIRSKGGEITVLLEDENLFFNVDKLHIKNVIGNLLDNAIKYCAVVPRIHIACKEENKMITIAVKDNGIGISEENLKHIFDRFYRVSTGNVHSIKGFGLGLNYVKLICKQHGGFIKVRSEVDKGSEFCIFIPKNKTN
jgi:two-component system, OmpR family, phosphate regulon sensor histidine kinase PhoR